MRALIYNELYLILRQKRTYFGLAAIFVIELFIIIGSWYQGNEIIEILLENLSKSFVLKGELLNGNLVLYIVLNTLWFNLPIIIMILVSGFITNDIKDGTLQLLMLQSVKKLDYIIAKYVVAIIFTLLVVLLLFISASMMAYLVFGGGDLITYLGGLNFFESKDAVTRILYAYLSGAVLMISYSFVSITLGVLFREITITWIACAFFLIISNLLLKMDISGIDRWFYPKLIDTWQYFFYFEIPWLKVHINHLMILVYSSILMGCGTYFFIKKDVG